jgi:predicted DCC family thiol-disulfide oxidoreductase YuxK
VNKHDVLKQFTPLAIQSEEGKKHARKYGLDAVTPHSVVLLENGEVLDKSEAGIKILMSLKGTKTLAKALKFLPEKIMNKAYDVIARHRFRIFGREK